jgi:hypothetical protein
MPFGDIIKFRLKMPELCLLIWAGLDDGIIPNTSCFEKKI